MVYKFNGKLFIFVKEINLNISYNVNGGVDCVKWNKLDIKVYVLYVVICV